jgi:hypothetical protein
VFNFDPEPSNPAGEIAAESQTQRWHRSNKERIS